MPFVTCNLIEEFCSQNEKVGKMSRVSLRFRTIAANEQGLALLGDLKNVRLEPLLMLC